MGRRGLSSVCSSRLYFVKTTAMSFAALLILLVTGMALSLDTVRRSFVYFAILFVGGVGVASILLIWNTMLLDAFVSQFGQQRNHIRLALWKEAGSLISHFPRGIGPGQFGLDCGSSNFGPRSATDSDRLGLDPSKLEFGYIPMRFVHNTFLSMLLEWGIASIFLITLLFIDQKSDDGLELDPSNVLRIYLVPTLLLHDSLGFRANYLILGLVS